MMSPSATNNATPALVTEYNTATEATHDWANLTGWTSAGVQVNSNRLYGVAAANPSAASKSFAVAASETAKVTAEIRRVTGVNRAQYVGFDFGGGVAASLPGFIGIGIGGTNNQPDIFIGANFTGVTTGHTFLSTDNLGTSTWRAIVMLDDQNISLVLRATDGSAEYSFSCARSAAPNSDAATAFMVWNGDDRGTSGSYIKAIGARKSLTPFVTQSNAAGTIEGNTGLVFYRNVSDRWRIHLPAGLNGKKPAPVAIYMHQSSTGDADSPISEARALNVDEALDAAGYIVISADDGGDRWGNSASLTNYAALLAWVRARVFCGRVALIGVSMGGVPAWNSVTFDQIEAAAIAGICPVCDLDAMEQDPTFQASVWAAYGAANHSQYVTNSAGWNPMTSANLSRFANKGVKFYVATSGDTIVPNATHVNLFDPLLDANARSSVVDTSGTGHLATAQFQGSDLVTLFNQLL